MIKTVNQAEAEKIFRSYGIDVLVWKTSSIQTGKHDGMICDYTKMKGYKIKYACEVWDINTNKQVVRFNVV